MKFFILCDFWWCRRGNLKSVILGSERGKYCYPELKLLEASIGDLSWRIFECRSLFTCFDLFSVHESPAIK